MIRTNHKYPDPAELTMEERVLKFHEMCKIVQERLAQQKENLLPPDPKEACEPLGYRTRAPQGRVPFGFQQNPDGRAAQEPEMRWIRRYSRAGITKTLY
jgi:hypothetical protein